jgi:hypothetical protein
VFTPNKQELAEPTPVSQRFMSVQASQHAAAFPRPSLVAAAGTVPGSALSALAVQTTPSYLAAMQHQEQAQQLQAQQLQAQQAKVAVAALPSSHQAAAAAAAADAAPKRRGLPGLLARGTETVSNMATALQANALKALSHAQADTGAVAAAAVQAAAAAASKPVWEGQQLPAAVAAMPQPAAYANMGVAAIHSGSGRPAAAVTAAPWPAVLPGAPAAPTTSPFVVATPKPDTASKSTKGSAVSGVARAVTPSAGFNVATAAVAAMQQQQQPAISRPPHQVAPAAGGSRVSIATAAAAPAAASSAASDLTAGAPVARLTYQLPQKVHVAFAPAAVHRAAPVNAFATATGAGFGGATADASSMSVSGGAVTPRLTPTWAPAAQL